MDKLPDDIIQFSLPIFLDPVDLIRFARTSKRYRYCLLGSQIVKHKFKKVNKIHSFVRFGQLADIYEAIPKRETIFIPLGVSRDSERCIFLGGNQIDTPEKLDAFARITSCVDGDSFGGINPFVSAYSPLDKRIIVWSTEEFMSNYMQMCKDLSTLNLQLTEVIGFVNNITGVYIKKVDLMCEPFVLIAYHNGQVIRSLSFGKITENVRNVITGAIIAWLRGDCRFVVYDCRARKVIMKVPLYWDMGDFAFNEDSPEAFCSVLAFYKKDVHELEKYIVEHLATCNQNCIDSEYKVTLSATEKPVKISDSEYKVTLSATEKPVKISDSELLDKVKIKRLPFGYIL